MAFRSDEYIIEHERQELPALFMGAIERLPQLAADLCRLPCALAWVLLAATGTPGTRLADGGAVVS